MKKYIATLTLTLMCLFGVNAQNIQTIRQKSISVGEKWKDFIYQDTKNTSDYANDYTGRSTNDVVYRLWLTRRMEVTISHCGSALSDTYLHLLDQDGNRIAYNDDYAGVGKCSNTRHSYLKKELACGVYYIVSEGYGSNGLITTTIEGKYIEPPHIDIGLKNQNFYWTDTYNTINGENNFDDLNGANDIIYKLTLSRRMEVAISHCGSEIKDTFLYLLDSAGNTIEEVDDYDEEGSCDNFLHPYLKRELPSGVYYIVCEGYRDNGIITTNIEGTIVPQNISVVPSSGKNYIVSKQATQPISSPEALTLRNSLQTVQYHDGLGRPSVLIQAAITPDMADLAAAVSYDEFGREYQQWLPAPADNMPGQYISESTFRDMATTYYSDSNPYSETIFETSALGRESERKNPGTIWHTHTVKTDYSANAVGEVKDFRISTAGKLECNGTHPSGTLHKTKITDEDGKTSTEYKNTLGQTIMTRQSSDHNTYYVYDNSGNLRYVLPPLASDALTYNTYEDTDDILQKYAYIYKYDYRNRNTLKKLPGCSPIYMVYDKADRLAYMQDGNIRTPRTLLDKYNWMVYQYDQKGRLAYHGCIFTTSNHSILISNTKNKLHDVEFDESKIGGYIPQLSSFPTKLLTVNYYDDYRFLNLTSDVNFEYDSSKVDFGIKYNNTKGLPTGNRTYLLDSSGKYIQTVYYYDYLGRIIQTRSNNHLGGYEIEYTKYDFTGNVLKSLKEHTIPSKSGNITHTETYEYTYDHAGRLLNTYYTLDNNEKIMLAVNEYDDLGKMKGKQQHNNKNEINYKYNIRNWLTGIQDGEFQQSLIYNNGTASGNFNGNISTMSLSNETGSSFINFYNYDELNRLKSNMSLAYGQFGFQENYNYDKHGNILILNRCATGGSPIDELSFTYSGNQISNISDAIDSHNYDGYGLKEYIDTNKEGDDFTYDANGNMTADKDRGISKIKYNLLNLPSDIIFSNGNKIENLYAADGRKLASRYLTTYTPTLSPIVRTLGVMANPNLAIRDSLGGPINWSDSIPTIENPWGPNTDNNYYKGTSTEYIGNIEYERQYSTETAENATNYDLLRIHNGEGYVDSDGKYNYYRKDYLGNNRGVWQVNSNNITTIQRTNYYPSGLPWVDGEGASEQPYKFGGKEFIEMHGLDEMDFHARMYYPAIMRFTI